jgi:hypothetical protein
MLGTLPRFLATSSLAAIFIGLPAQAPGQQKEANHRFKITIASSMDMDIQGQKQKLVADTEIIYSWMSKDRQRTLSFESMFVKVKKDDKPMMDTLMSRAKFTNTVDGKATVIELEKAPEALKNILQDSFGVPVCKVQIDEKGQEVKRTMVAGPGAKTIMDNGLVANALIFHTPFVRAKDEWQAESEMSMGNGGFAKGKLTYKKVPGEKDTQAFKVSGVLTNDGFTPPGSPMSIKKPKYVVGGNQVYDPTSQEWVSGRYTIDLSYVMSVDDKVVGTTKGNMILNFERLPGGK